MIHSNPAAIHSAGELGMASSAKVASTAPARKYGRRRPNLPQVRSEKWPINGCTINPVSGAAIHNAGISDTLAPSVWKMRLTLAFCSAKPNWMPRKPKHMFQICQNDSAGLSALIMVWSVPPRRARFAMRGSRPR